MQEKNVYFLFTPEKVPLLIMQHLKPLYFIYIGKVLQAHCQFLLMSCISNLFVFIHFFIHNGYIMDHIVCKMGQMSLDCILELRVCPSHSSAIDYIVSIIVIFIS